MNGLYFRKPNEKGSKLRRGRPVGTSKMVKPGSKKEAVGQVDTGLSKAMHHMDDDELKKVSIEAGRKTAGKATLIRRRSDLSSSSGSTATSMASSRNLQTVAKLSENIPETFGKSDHEMRLTRSKLKTLLEPSESASQDDDVASTTSTASTVSVTINSEVRLTRRNSRRQQQQQQQQIQLEQVNENEELKPTPTAITTTKMSAHNLRKHNAAMEKLAEDGREEDDSKQVVST